MSINLTIENALNVTAQYVKDQDGNTSSLSLTKDGNVGIGIDNPEKKLDINGPIRIKNTDQHQAIFFVDSDFTIGTEHDSFTLRKGGFRIIQVYGTNRLSFDNVDVHPDDDNQQSLGLENNRWKELHVADISCTGSLNLKNLETPPSGVQTVDLVMDPDTGKIYRKPPSPPSAPTDLNT